MPDIYVTLAYVVLGALVGGVGQGARAAVGIKKAREEATPEQLEDGSWWDGRRLLLSFLIGAVAGVLYVVTQFGSRTITPEVSQGFLVTLVGVGYAGTDFIEGVLKGRITGRDGEGGGEPDGEPEEG